MKAFTLLCCVCLSHITTAYGWSDPVIISKGSINYEPYASVNKRGEAAVVWINRGGTMAIHSSWYDGAQWSPCTILSSTGDNFNPKVCLNAQGDAIALWDAFLGSRQAVIAAVKKAGEAWKDAEVISLPA